MSAAQALLADAMPASDAPPSTEVAADALARAATGSTLPEDRKSVGGELVHYAFGLALGAVYGLLAERRPGVTRGTGGLFGAAAAIVFDEIMVPALRLSPPPVRVPASSHAFGFASHLLFGVTTETGRRLLRGGRIPAPGFPNAGDTAIPLA